MRSRQAPSESSEHSTWPMLLIAALGGAIGGEVACRMDCREVGLVIILGLMFSTALLIIATYIASIASRPGTAVPPYLLGVWYSPISLPAACACALLNASCVLS